jgi:tetratricopeptide (TPR) repeat protein
MQTLVIQSELALDHLKAPEKAAFYHQKMERAARNDADKALAHYVEGRLLLFEGNFSMARVSFTRSNRIAGSGEIADKSRYYLGLGDFYNGDFTYARLQLRSLERHSHSWYANNALELRYMIQEGHNEGEESRTDRYARARYLYDTGRYAEAAEKLAPVLDEPAANPFMVNPCCCLHARCAVSTPNWPSESLTATPAVHPSPGQAGERLLWERARLAESTLHQAAARTSESIRSAEGLIPPEILSSHLLRRSGFMEET